MDLELLLMVFFIVGSAFWTAVSWRSLRHPRSHGFYRYFAFEGILILALLNAPVWFHDPFSPRQLFSWLLLNVSAILAIHGFHLLRVAGGPRQKTDGGPDLRFERTSRLVTSGAYRYIRHPLYASLICLAWGTFLKDISWLTFAVVAVTTAFLFATARVEERENVEHFGESYLEYSARTKMFIPYVW
jgi:protein-S-isoprenylcysteine O-methyltransferase Ste14